LSPDRSLTVAALFAGGRAPIFSVLNADFLRAAFFAACGFFTRQQAGWSGLLEQNNKQTKER
jgi:hypothetical protein